MKTTTKMLVLLLLVGLLGSGCATVSKLNAEYEEELIRVEQMSPEQKAEWETNRQEREKINWNEFVGGGEN
jgi:uncharacterized protein YceK